MSRQFVKSGGHMRSTGLSITGGVSTIAITTAASVLTGIRNHMIRGHVVHGHVVRGHVVRSHAGHYLVHVVRRHVF